MLGPLGNVSVPMTWNRRVDLFVATIAAVFAQAVSAQPPAGRGSPPAAPLSFQVIAPTKLFSHPDATSPVIAGLRPGDVVQLGPGAQRGRLFPVRAPGGQSGWVDGRLLVPPGMPNLAALTETSVNYEALLARTESKYPKCGSAKHYRWAAKVSAPDNQDPGALTVATILSTWQPPSIDVGQSLAAWCVPRIAAEDRTFALTGYVTRIKRAETDGDWHIELVTHGSAVTNCVVAEIPSPTYAAGFAMARTDLLAKVAAAGATIDGNGDLSKPVQVTLVGDAFYDGWHTNSSGSPVGHGRCNSSPRALWELHPVFVVQQ